MAFWSDLGAGPAWLVCGGRGYIGHRLWFAWPWTVGLTTWWQDEAAAYRFAHMPQHLRLWAWGAEPGHTRGGWLAHYRYVRGGPLWGNGVQAMSTQFAGRVPAPTRCARPPRSAALFEAYLMRAGLVWALLICSTEYAWRRCTRSRARAWQLSAITLSILTRIIQAPPSPMRKPNPHVIRGSCAPLTPALSRGERGFFSRSSLWPRLLGLALALGGYPLGRAALSDRAASPPPDTWTADAIGLGLMAVAEELTWRARVEPVLGLVPTAVLFAVKHPLINGRWRRGLGLGLFWIGLGLAGDRFPPERR